MLESASLNLNTEPAIVHKSLPRDAASSRQLRNALLGMSNKSQSPLHAGVSVVVFEMT